MIVIVQQLSQIANVASRMIKCITTVFPRSIPVIACITYLSHLSFSFLDRLEGAINALCSSQLFCCGGKPIGDAGGSTVDFPFLVVDS